MKVSKSLLHGLQPLERPHPAGGNRTRGRQKGNLGTDGTLPVSLGRKDGECPGHPRIPRNAALWRNFMGSKWILEIAVLVAVTFVVVLAVPAPAQTAIVLHDFSNSGTDGNTSYSGVILDSAGNMYGSTAQGGAYNGGIVFELNPRIGGGWTYRILHAFNPAVGEGSGPGGMALDASGNLYGCTGNGGTDGLGTVFELKPVPSGGWAMRTLYSFNGTDGSSPTGNLIFDSAGNLYGTTGDGGSFGLGTAYKLTRGPGGAWVETVLHNFPETGTDGYEPLSGLIFDAAGNLYGTTFYGGMNFCLCGTVFELSPTSSGAWTETILHNFADDGIDGGLPIARPTFDTAGNLYGTTFVGGSGSLGVVYELAPSDGGWTETILHAFANNGDGIIPGYGPLIADAEGNLYDTTQEGGNLGNGTIYKLTPGTGGSWTYATYFKLDGTNGASPVGGPSLDRRGDLYGTTQGGGAGGVGVVYEVRP